MKIDPASVPFKRVLKCNIGNPQSLKQKPMSFVRDVLSITLNPSLVESAHCSS
jgi:alanine transaminase